MNNLDNPSGCMDLGKRRKSKILKPLIAVYLVALGAAVFLIWS
jgi:hypothetical protein